MMQTQWPGLGPNLDLSSLDAAAGSGRQTWPGDGGWRAAPPQASADGIARPWWTCGTAGANGGDPSGGLLGGTLGSLGTGGSLGASGALGGLLSGLVGVLQQLVGALANQNQGSSWQSPVRGGPQQLFQNVDVSSTGDPHIAEVGTREGPDGPQAVDARWDSMTAHDDLVHSNQISGGYRVSTAVTAPDAGGVTFNQSATVHAGFDQDAVTLNRDGSFAIYSDGRAVQLGKGESATLSGGEQVTANQDGSLSVTAKNARGGSVATTLRSTGQGVDVTTHAHEIGLGGDAIAHGAHDSRGAQAVQN